MFYGYGYNYGAESYMLLLMIVPFILSIGAQIWVKAAYRKMLKIRNGRGYTGAQAAAAVLRYYGITDVRIEPVRGKLSDHFDPRTNVIRLSEGVYASDSVAALGIACHEAGHAAQHAQNYAPVKVRNSIVPVCNIGSFAGIPLALLGFYLAIPPLVWVGLGLYAMIAVFQLVTLPVELNASARALKVIEEAGITYDGVERQGAKKVLTAAAMTYVAALAVTLMNLLRFALIIFGRQRN
ncbi:MAG: zinc metallopeptidase [Oscillospiraceae bacterium]|nr:zinc metallopeptidase [Oscillospiraceae bacterium]